MREYFSIKKVKLLYIEMMMRIYLYRISVVNDGRFSIIISENKSGDDGLKVTPVPIPNTKVKLQCADGTAGVTLWESRLSPGQY